MGEPWMWRNTILSLVLNLLARVMVQVTRWAAAQRCKASRRPNHLNLPRPDRDSNPLCGILQLSDVARFFVSTG